MVPSVEILVLNCFQQVITFLKTSLLLKKKKKSMTLNLFYFPIVADKLDVQAC